MALAVKKYNPGFLSDDEIIESFCVRTSEFESIIECLRENTGNSSSHSLVIGPRGSGKTHLLLRVAVEVRRDETLAGLFPVVFPEESYEVSTCGEFWLECLGHLAEQAPPDERESLRLTYNDLRTVQEDQVLADRCIGVLLDFADRHQKRLVLLVENLNMLFSDMGDPDAGWRLRKTLQTEPRIILLGSATSRFEEIDSPEHALYDLFRVVTLRPLNTEECEVLWKAVSGKPTTTRAVRPLEILTGGNPRLLAIIARFGAGQSFRELMSNLLDLVDEHTEYFKSHLEALPPQERRVYLALARLWKPSTTREVSELARVDTNKCSSMLGRLVRRGSVAIEGGTARRKEYYLTERLYNIYYLLRRGGGEDRLVQALIDFMISFYSPLEMWNFITGLYNGSDSSIVLFQNVSAQMTLELIDEAHSLADKGKVNEALSIYEQVIQQATNIEADEIETLVAWTQLNQSFLLERLGRHSEVISTCERLVRQFGNRTDEISSILVQGALTVKATALINLDRPRDAMDTCDLVLNHIRTIKDDSDDVVVPGLTLLKGLAFMLMNNSTDALAAFDRVIYQYDSSERSSFTAIAAHSLTLKTIMLDQKRQTISDEEFSLLLNCLGGQSTLQPGNLDALECFIARVTPAHALELIQESPSVELLLPLVTVLQQELGQSTVVAKEIAEVAKDLRRELVEFRTRADLGKPTVSDALGVKTPREFLNSVNIGEGRLRYPGWARAGG